MTTRAGGVVVWLEASVEDFTRGMALAGRSLAGFERASESATRTTAAIQRSIRMLAVEAVGVEGPFARIGEHILGALGPNAGPIVAAVAGAGIVVKLFSELGKGAEETAKRIDALAKSNRDFVTGMNQVGAVGGKLFGGGDKGQEPNLVEQQSAIAGRLNTLRTLREHRMGPTDIQSQIDTQEELLRQVTLRIEQTQSALGKAKAKVAEAAADAAGQIIDAAGAKAVEAARKAMEKNKALIERQLSTTAANPFGVIDTAGLSNVEQKAFLDRGGARAPLTLDLARDQGFQDIKLKTAGERYTALAKAQDDAAKKAQDTARNIDLLASGIQLLGSVAGSSGNRIGQFLMGAGGVVSGIPGGQLAGAGIALGGAIVNLFGGGHDSLPVRVTNGDELAAAQKKRIGPEKTSVNYIVLNEEMGKQAEYIVRRTQNLGGVIRYAYGSAA